MQTLFSTTRCGVKTRKDMSGSGDQGFAAMPEARLCAGIWSAEGKPKRAKARLICAVSVLQRRAERAGARSLMRAMGAMIAARFPSPRRFGLWSRVASDA